MPRFSFSRRRPFVIGRLNTPAHRQRQLERNTMARYFYAAEGAPVNGTSGTYAAVALPGALLVTDEPALYQNTGTQASPTWTTVGSGGGSDVLVDPGTSFVAGAAVAAGDRIMETVEYEDRVFEAANSGTNESAIAFTDYTVDLTPLGVTTSNDVDWRYLGIVGQIAWDVAPQLPALVNDANGLNVVSRHPWNNPDTMLQLLPALADPGVAWAAMTAYSLNDRVTATVAGRLRVFQCIDVGTSGATEPDWSISIIGNNTSDNDILWIYLGIVAGPDWQHPLFVTNSAGDAEWLLDQDQASQFRWSVALNGVGLSPSKAVSINPDRFIVFSDTAHFEVLFDPFAIDVVGLPTSDPAIAGRLWNDTGTLKISAG